MATLAIDTERLVDICRANDAMMVGIFGSTARGEATPASDIDSLVRFSKPKSLLNLVVLDFSALMSRPRVVEA
jgi:uncharacterized protein